MDVPPAFYSHGLGTRLLPDRVSVHYNAAKIDLRKDSRNAEDRKGGRRTSAC